MGPGLLIWNQSRLHFGCVIAKNDNLISVSSGETLHTKYLSLTSPVATEYKRANWPKIDEEVFGQDVQASSFSAVCGAWWSNIALLTD